MFQNQKKKMYTRQNLRSTQINTNYIYDNEKKSDTINIIMDFISWETIQNLPDFPSDIVKYKKDYREERGKPLKKLKRSL